VRAGVAWKRVYANGIVVLDPSPSTSQSVSLGGNYVLPNGRVGSTVTVGPTQAVVLYAACGRRRCAGRQAMHRMSDRAARAVRRAVSAGR